METNKYQSNSHKSKESSKEEQGNLPAKKEKLEPIVNSKVTVKKKGTIKKFTDIFVAEDLNSVGEYLLNEFVVPGAKRLFVDLMFEGAKALVGERGTTRRSTVDRYSVRPGYTDYTRASDRRDSRYAAPQKNVYSYDDIIFSSRGEAELVRDALFDQIEEYGMVSIGDLYDLVEVTGNYTDYKYGWTDLRTATIERSRDGYYIRLPRAVALK